MAVRFSRMQWLIWSAKSPAGWSFLTTILFTQLSILGALAIQTHCLQSTTARLETTTNPLRTGKKPVLEGDGPVRRCRYLGIHSMEMRNRVSFRNPVSGAIFTLLKT